MDTCPVCKHADELISHTDGSGYCYRCGVFIAPPNQIGEEEEPTPEQSAALAHYIAAREEWEGLRDDIRWGGWRETNDARRNLSAATATYHAAKQQASIAGVLSVGRAMFR